jgi:hypothetical protein
MHIMSLRQRLPSLCTRNVISRIDWKILFLIMFIMTSMKRFSENGQTENKNFLKRKYHNNEIMVEGVEITL